jgi:IS30 family transposase
MSHYCNDTIRTPDFGYLSMTERVKIEAGLRHGLSPASIAREIGRTPPTVKREMKRGWASRSQEAGSGLRPLCSGTL